MHSITYTCDGCGREYKYENMYPGGSHRPIEKIQPLKERGRKEYCRACYAKAVDAEMKAFEVK